MNSPVRKNILTIATGKKLYADLAVNLARSFFWSNPNSDINFQIVTDAPENIPSSLANRVEIIEIKSGEFGNGFSPKLHLDQLVSEGQTIFIDSDCLVFRKLDPLFQVFKGKDVSVLGNLVSDGEWFGDVTAICKKYSLPHIPKFNGGLYYLQKGEIAHKIYSAARQLEQSYDEIGFVRLRGLPNDEVIMAVAMQLFDQKPIIDDGTVMSDPQACQANYSIDIIKGLTLLENPPAPHPLNQDWYPFHLVSPMIFHFLGNSTDDYPYKREVFRLARATTSGVSIFYEMAAIALFECPHQSKKFLKDLFRPLYRRILGTRNVKISRRI